MMTRDGITTLATRPGLEIDPELRLSLTWVIAVLVCVGSVVTFMGELLVEPVQRLSLIPLVCFGLAMLIWWLDRLGGTRLGRWFTLIGLSILINLAFIRFGISDLYLLMILLPLLALSLMTWTAALLTALLETIGLLFLWPTIGIDPISLVLTIGLIWTVLGLLLAIIGPQVRRSQWLYDQFHRAQQRLDETRDQKVQFAQMQEDLQSAYQTQELLNQRLVVDDQVRVRLEASGVCHSDWHIVKGEWVDSNRPPVILGHEGAGVVEEIGLAVHNVKVGDHVVLSWVRNCGVSEMCQVGYPNLCEEPWDHRGQPRFPDSERTMKRMNALGTFSTETIVPQDIAIPIDPEIPFSQAALVGCGVMTGVGAALNTANVQPGKSVAVFGCGGVGLNVNQGAVIAGAEPIIAVDIQDNKLEMGKLFGATHTVNSAQVDPVEAIQELTDGKGVH